MALVSLVTIPVGLGCYAIEMRDYAEKYGRVVAAKGHMGATIVEYIGGCLLYTSEFPECGCQALNEAVGCWFDDGCVQVGFICIADVYRAFARPGAIGDGPQ